MLSNGLKTPQAEFDYFNKAKIVAPSQVLPNIKEVLRHVLLETCSPSPWKWRNGEPTY